MNSPLNKVRVIEVTKLRKYPDTELRGLRLSPRFAVPICKLITDALKRSHEEVPWAASGPLAVG